MNRVYFVDGLRGVFSILIMVYHYYSWGGMSGPAPFMSFLEKSSIYAVSGFFLISGFSLGFVYLGKDISLKVFFVKRFIRIAPLYYFVMFVALLRHSGSPHFGFASLLDLVSSLAWNFSFLFGFAKPAVRSMIVGGWSIGIEFSLYLLLPLVLFFVKKMGKTLWEQALLLVIAPLLITVFYNNLYLDPEATMAPQWGEYCNVLAYVYYFFAGVFVACVYKKECLKINPAYAKMLLVAFVALYILYYSRDLEDVINVVYGIPGLVFLVCVTGVVVCGVYIPVERKILRIVCEHAGGISYPLYLLHYFSFSIVTGMVEGTTKIFFWSIFVTIISATLVYFLYEKPLRYFLAKKILCDYH